MPGGQAGGAQAGGRFYRNSALSITTSETDIPLDTVSAINPLDGPFQCSLLSGSIKSAVAGISVADMTLTVERPAMLNVGLTLRAYLTPDGGSPVLIGKGEHTLLAGGGTQTVNLPVYTPIDVDGTISFTGELGTGSLAVATGENETWAYFVLG